jgi:drug/metabolite transporter (DMT)-like permease
LSSPAVFAAAIYAGAFSSGIAFVTWRAGVRLLGASHASIYQNLLTLIAVIGGWLLLAEPVMMAQLLGGGLVLVGLIVMRRSRATTKPNERANQVDAKT